MIAFLADRFAISRSNRKNVPRRTIYENVPRGTSQSNLARHSQQRIIAIFVAQMWCVAASLDQFERAFEELSHGCGKVAAGFLGRAGLQALVATEEQISEWDKHPELRRNQPRSGGMKLARGVSPG
ncbi:MAG: hypothetical protein WBW69_11745 [Candidatus Korobacteraceae bacterium]